MQKVYAASAIFTGAEWLYDTAVVVKDGLIDELVPQKEWKGAPFTKNFDGLSLVPAFIDAQVYGASGKLFSQHPVPGTLAAMHKAFSQQGTLLFQPTIATNTLEVFRKGIDAVRDYWKGGGAGVHGLHLEGPWLNEKRRGAHRSEWIHAPTATEVDELLEYGRGVITMITLAPEVCGEAIMALIASQGIVISAGHSDATYAQATESFDGYAHTVTHLYNAMSPLHHRAPGLVGAAFEHATVRASIIPDGHHVDFAAIAIAKKIMGPRLFAITDAVTDTDEGPYRHVLEGDKYVCNGVLSGSAISMHKAMVNLVKKAGVKLEEALRMCSLYPAQALRCEDRYGKIAPGYTGQFLLLNKQLELAETVTA